MHEEEKDGDQLCGDCACDKLSQHDLGSTMSQSSMSEEEIRQAIQVLHLNICACKYIRLLVVLDQTNSNVSLADCKLVRLLGNDADNIAQLALNRKLSDSLNNKLSLYW